MQNRTEMMKFLASLTVYIENAEPFFEEIIEAELKALSAVHIEKENVICKKYMHNSKLQKRHLDKFYQRRAKEVKSVRRRYDYFIEVCKNMVSALKDANDKDKEVLENIISLFRSYVNNINIS